jgi:iron uptake system component EfeO
MAALPTTPRPARRPRQAAAAVLAAALLLSACGEDDGGTVRDVGGGSDSGSASASGSGSSSASGSASGSSSGSGSGIEDASGVAGSTDDPLVLQAIDDYRTYVIAEVDQLVVDAMVFTDAVRAGDLEGAKAAYAPSRQAWERIEPIAGLVEEIDGKVDARVDDFAGEDDPEFTGWHRIEHILFELGTTDGAAAFADQLDADLATLQTEIESVDFPPATVALGAAELIQEVSEGKITGEEDRYSGTDLWDFAANVEGAAKVIELLTPALEAADAELLADIEAGFTRVEEGLAPYADGEGWQPFENLTPEDTDELKAALAGLSEDLAEVPGALGLAG